MKNLAVLLAGGALLMATPGWAQEGGQGRAIVTILPAHEGQAAPAVTLADVKIKVSGRAASVTGWTAQRGAESRLELVVLIDSSARTSLGSQLEDIAHFVREAPEQAKVAIGYMQNGQAALTGPLTADATEALRGLHLPSGSAGSNGSPYFCLSDLAKNWPSSDGAARREVVMITDGVDEYQTQFDPDDPYVQAAIADSVKAGLVVFPMYWSNRGGGGNSGNESNVGQNLLMEVSDATGGTSYWEGSGNPVSFEPFFQDLRRRLQNQYALRFAARLEGKPGVESLKVHVGVAGKVSAPQQVYVGRAGGDRE
jgi:hypothetical protein